MTARHSGPPPRSAHESKGGGSRIAKVLVIDDNPYVRRMISLALRTRGHLTIEAGNGRDGVELFVRAQPDLVITDILMPVQEGIETVAQIREVSTVPIIVISGTPDAGEFAPLLDAKLIGADVAIQKPFTAEALLDAVEELLGR